MVFRGSRLVFHGSTPGRLFIVPGRFSWFFMVPGWFFMVPDRLFIVCHGSRLTFMVFHGSRLVFHGSRLVFMVFLGSRLVFHGSRLIFMVFHGSRFFFMVPGGFLWFFMGPGWFFMVPGWFFMDPGWFSWFSMVLWFVFHGAGLVFHVFSWCQVVFSCFFSKMYPPNCILAQRSSLGPPPGWRHRT